MRTEESGHPPPTGALLPGKQKTEMSIKSAPATP